MAEPQPKPQCSDPGRVLLSRLHPCFSFCPSSLDSSHRVPCVILAIISEPALCLDVFLEASEPEMQIPLSAVHPRPCAKAGQDVPVTVQESTTWAVQVIPPVALHITLGNSTPENPGTSLGESSFTWSSTQASSGSRQTRRPRPIHLLIRQPCTACPQT